MLLAVSGCATGTVFLGRSGPVSGEPWELPEDSYPTQRLYRVKYQGPKGDAGFKLTLYLQDERRYRMLAADTLGRKLWSLAVERGDLAIWLDHRRKEYCRSSAAGTLRLVPIADLPLLSLPKLLLGRLPAVPAASLTRDAGRVAFLDAKGQLWNAGLHEEQLEWWSLLEAGEAVIWWRREDRGGLFEDPRGDQQFRWLEVVREQLDGALDALEIPARYREGACGAAAAPE